MKREYRKWWSPALGREMELLRFGAGGAPVIVFPTSLGRFYEWEDFGMVAHLAGRIDEGWLELWCVDAVDAESFYDSAKPPQQRAARHLSYERYLADELLPAIRSDAPVDYLILAGASSGAFHALAFVTRRPGIARKAIGLSGTYDSARWLDGARDGNAYFVNPLAFLPDLQDERYLAPLRETEIVLAAGRDDPNVDESRRLVALLQEKGCPASLHLWDGEARDWPYWKDMVDAFL